MVRPYCFHVEPPTNASSTPGLPVDGELSKAARTAPWSLSVLLHRRREPNAQLLEHYTRSDPYNWFNFFDFWHEGGLPEEPARERRP